MQVSEAVQVAPTEQMVNLVAVENNQTVTTSLKVAEVFGKQHKNVMQAIKSLDCSEDFRELNFKPSKFTYSNGNIKKQLPMYYITRDGFMFLVMGFTGKTAAKWKEAYIRAFNDMEAKLRAEQTERAIKAAVESERIEDAEYKKQLEREEREEAEVDRRVEEYARQRAEEAKAEAEAQARANEQGGIVEIVGGKRVISSVTIARLTDRRHCDVLESIRRMFKHSDRPTRMFIKSERWAKKANCARAARFYYVTIGGFVLLRKYTHSISYEVHVEVMRAFGDNKGMSRQQLGLDTDTPTATPPTKPRKPRAQHPAPTKPQAPQAQTVATMPQTPTDLMQRFVKAMGVMMGVDTNEMFNLMQKGE